MRCFIAVDLPDNVKEYLATLPKEFSMISGKFVEKENLHLTFRFLGDIPGKNVEYITQKFQEIKFPKIRAYLNNMGVFPSQKFARVLWIALEPKEKIIELKEKIDLALRDIDLLDDNKKFKSHVTLARIKSINNKGKFFGLLEKFRIKPLEFEIKSFVLKKSVLNEKGPTYSDVCKIDLT